jgi:hypothetical protein
MYSESSLAGNQPFLKKFESRGKSVFCENKIGNSSTGIEG